MPHVGRGGGLPREGVGAKKFGKPGKSNFFCGISRDFLPGYPGGAQKV